MKDRKVNPGAIAVLQSNTGSTARHPVALNNGDTDAAILAAFGFGYVDGDLVTVDDRCLHLRQQATCLALIVDTILIHFP